MTDETPDQIPDETATARPTAGRPLPGAQAASRPSPGAQAASRARRIGGRPRPGPAPAVSDPVHPSPAHRGADGRGRTATAAEPAVTAEPAAEPAVTAEPAAAKRAPVRLPGWLDWLPAGAFAAVAAVLLVFIGLAAWDIWGGDSTDVGTQRGQVLAAAKTCMATMNTYDYRKLDDAEAKGLACTTGKLTGQYKQAMEQLIKPQAAKVHFTQTAQVNKAGVETVSSDGTQWTVLIFGQLATTNSQTGTNTPKLTIFSARVTMQHVGDRWLVANYEYAPAS
jgi:hypothetical protein